MSLPRHCWSKENGIYWQNHTKAILYPPGVFGMVLSLTLFALAIQCEDTLVCLFDCWWKDYDIQCYTCVYDWSLAGWVKYSHSINMPMALYCNFKGLTPSIVYDKFRILIDGYLRISNIKHSEELPLTGHGHRFESPDKISIFRYLKQLNMLLFPRQISGSQHQIVKGMNLEFEYWLTIVN